MVCLLTLNLNFNLNLFFMDNRGFKIYRGIEEVSYPEIEEIQVSVSDVKSESDKIFDLIFASDSNRVPCGSVATMLSDKTSDDVRQFIQRNLIDGSRQAHLINDEGVVNEFQKMSSDFIAKCSRNRYESIEQYEDRLQQIIKDDNLATLVKSFNEKLNKK